jgi:DNA-directed RNA polymerase specialized sigma24 family protein
METGDAELLRLIATGHRAAFDAFYSRHAPWLALRLRRRCRDLDLVAELLQETFLTVWRAAATYRGEGEVPGWLWTIASRRLVDLRRRASVRPRTVAAAQEALLAPSPSAEDEAMAGAFRGPLLGLADAAIQRGGVLVDRGRPAVRWTRCLRHRGARPVGAASGRVSVLDGVTITVASCFH